MDSLVIVDTLRMTDESTITRGDCIQIFIIQIMPDYPVRSTGSKYGSLSNERVTKDLFFLLVLRVFLKTSKAHFIN